MNILYIANIRLPTEKAHGIQIMKMCEAFADLGHTIELVVPTRHTHITEDAFSYYGVARIFALTKLTVPDWVRFGRVGFLSSLLIFSERARWLKHFWSADIIYSRDALVLLQYMLLGRCIVFEAHTKPSRAARFVARRAHKVVVISRALKEAYIASGVSEEKIIVAHDAVDEHLFDSVASKEITRATLTIPRTSTVIMYVGHLYAHKGVATLAQVAEHMPDNQFIFVGGTERDIAYFRKQWGSIQNINIVGHMSPAKVPQYLRTADVLVIPNSAKNEDASKFTSPMKLFEYMASGTPIVASRVPSLQEVLTENEAVFFTPDDAGALTDSINEVLSNEKESHERTENAKQKVARYTWKKRAERICKFI